MTKQRGWLWAVVAIGAIVVSYHWLGIASLGIGLVVFIFFELLNPPPRYRRFGPGQTQEAADNRFGISGRNYREDEPDRASLHVGRNDRCPCGSGLKFKQCCGRDSAPQD
jgi:preprotein translocase subunit SecA